MTETLVSQANPIERYFEDRFVNISAPHLPSSTVEGAEWLDGGRELDEARGLEGGRKVVGLKTSCLGALGFKGEWLEVEALDVARERMGGAAIGSLAELLRVWEG